MNIEYDTRMVRITGDMADEVQRWQADGWQVSPGSVPVAIYHLIRVSAQTGERPMPQFAATAEFKLKLDEDKMGIIRNGEVLPFKS